MNREEGTDSRPENTVPKPDSLLDVVLPFPNSPKTQSPENREGLQNQVAELMRQRDDILREQLALDRAELLAERARVEQQEAEARIIAEREEAIRFQQKANQLAAEIERIRENKLQEQDLQNRQSTASHAQRANKFPPASPFAAQPAMAEQDQLQTLKGAQMGEGGLYFSNIRKTPRQERSRVRQDYQDPPSYRELPSRDAMDPPAPHYGDQRQGASYASWPDRNQVYTPGFQEQAFGQNDVSRTDTYQNQVNQNGRYSGNRTAPPPYQSHEPLRAPDNRDYPQYFPLPESTPYRQPAPEQVMQNQAHHPHHFADTQPSSPPPADANLYITPAEDGLYGQNPAAEQPAQTAYAPQMAQASHAGGFTIDLDAVMRSILSSWKMISVLAVSGAVLAGAYAMSLPNMYQAWAELSLDPRDVKVVDSQLTRSDFGGEGMIANLQSQLRIIESSSVLNVVIDNEGLMEDPEFNGENKISTGFLDSIFPPSAARSLSIKRQRVLEKLQKALNIVRGSQTFIIAIGITTEDPEKSARIANSVASAYVNGEIGARSQVARNASASLQKKLETLRLNVLNAEKAVEEYKTRKGLISSEGKLVTEVQLSRLNEQLAIAKIDVISTLTQMEQAKATDLTDVISGALPNSLNSGTISSLRIKYSVLKTNADRLATKLGPKHPERIAVEAELESTKRQIRQEIRRRINGTTKSFQRAKQRQKNLKQQVIALEAQASGVGESQIELRELERKLDAHDRIYKNYLLRSRETGEQEGILTTNTREITEATPPLNKVGPSRKIYVGMGLVAGALLGIFLAALSGMFGWKLRLRKRRAAGVAPQQPYPPRDDRYQQPAPHPYPQGYVDPYQHVAPRY